MKVVEQVPLSMGDTLYKYLKNIKYFFSQSNKHLLYNGQEQNEAAIIYQTFKFYLLHNKSTTEKRDINFACLFIKNSISAIFLFVGVRLEVV